MKKKEERNAALEQLRRWETLDNQSASREPSSLKVNRRHMLTGAGMFFGGSGALAALTTPAGATSEEEDTGEVTGLWQTIVSAPGNPFPPFKAFEVYGGGGTWTGSGQPDLTPAALASTAWGTWEQLGERKFRVIGRFWTYDPSANPTGFAALEFTVTVSEDGKKFHAEGPTQFFDNNGNPLGPPTTTFDDGTRITFPAG